MYDVEEEDVNSVVDQSQLSAVAQSTPLQRQLPVVELLGVFDDERGGEESSARGCEKGLHKMIKVSIWLAEEEVVN
ncbi:hypothetical protein U1Q18_010163 [Sarracenia purpurea var. burkii]